MKNKTYLTVLSIITITLLVTGCAGMWETKQPQIRTVVQSSSYLNPSLEGKSSPVVLTIYQLRSSTQFESEEFYALANNPSQVLGSALIDKEQIALRPEEKRDLKIPLSTDARYIGVIVAFRDLNNSQWRAIVPIKKTKNIRLNLEVGTQSVTASIG